MTSAGYDEYRRHEKRLIHLRWRNRGLDSPAEDAILAAMDDAWSQLTAEERTQIDAEPPRSLIRVIEVPGRRIERDVDIFSISRVPVRIFNEVA